MEWQFNIGTGPQNQNFWLDDISQPNPATDLGRGGARISSTIKAAAKHK
jgi:hypothetical protein